MDHRGHTPDPARLRQVREELHLERPRSAHPGADPAQLADAWPLELRRRRLVEALDRELADGQPGEDGRSSR